MKLDKIKKKIIPIGLFILANIICPIIVSKIENINYKDAFFSLWTKIINFAKNILTFSIPIWAILIIITILYIILKIYLKLSDLKTEDDSWYKDYSSDTYNNLMYEWKYNRIGNQIEMKDVIPICEKCKGNVLPKESGYNTILYCPNCNKSYKNPNSEEYDSARVYFNNKLRKIIQEHNKSQE